MDTRIKHYAVHLTGFDGEFLMVVKSPFWADREVYLKAIRSMQERNPELGLPHIDRDDDVEEYLARHFDSWWYASEDD